MSETLGYKKKLIEVAIPLEAINKASAREKSIRHGHPSTLHLWWARRPLAACRAVLFASLVDDPSSNPELFPNEAAQEMERRRLFKIIEDLVKWENSNNEEVLAKARAEIMRSTNNNPPPVLDPFCGGGSIPLEAQRLGLEAYGSDLNPVAVLITKALIEIPPKFTSRHPVNPETQKSKKRQSTSCSYNGAEGLAADVSYYGEWMKNQAFKKIGKLYPSVKLSKDYGGSEASVIAWIWARTVKCPNPACGCEMPLVRSFSLSAKKGKEAWIEPNIKKSRPPQIEFVVKTGKGIVPDTSKVGRGAKFKCLACNLPTADSYIKGQGLEGKMSQTLMAVIAEGPNGRAYLSPDKSHVEIANKAIPSWMPEEELAYEPRAIWCTGYGLKKFKDLFTKRQLVALTTFSELVGQAREKIIKDAIVSGMTDDGKGLEDGGFGATAYADAVSVYLAFGVSRLADRSSTVCSWDVTRDTIRNTFARQAIPMSWDFAEGNPFSDSSGNFSSAIEWIKKVIVNSPVGKDGHVSQRDAVQNGWRGSYLIATDPPYYDNIGYADLSDFFYVWIRNSLRHLNAKFLETILVPKSAELIATPYRFKGSKEKAKDFFESGFKLTFKSVSMIVNPSFPLIIYYAFKQSDEVEDADTAFGEFSTGWETMLSAVISSGYTIAGTWPLRTELSNRSVARNTNALASSIAIVCRPRPASAKSITFQEFKRNLKIELKRSIKDLLQSNIAPVDLPQSAIGPGIAVFSKYKSVLDVGGEAISISKALVEINRVLAEFLDASADHFDQDTLWAIEWYKINKFDHGSYGDAENLARAKNTTIEGIAGGGIAIAKAGKVKLLSRCELPNDWDPQQDRRTSIWEKTQHLAKRLEDQGESATAKIVIQLGSSAEDAKSLAYRLFSIAESKGWVEEAMVYNALIMSWSEINKLTA